MSIQTPKSPASYAQEVFAALQATGIQQTSPGGIARALSDIISTEMGTLETNTFINITASILPYATGDDLDLIGGIYNVTRIGRQDASTSVDDNNFMFYVKTGTFGAINNGQDITVPAGTQLFTDSSTGPIYVTDQTYILPAADSSMIVSAVSLQTGASGNAASGAFTRSNFTNYTDSSFGSLLVANNFGIVSGRDTEDDDSYRYRINLELQIKGGSEDIALRAKLLQLPGIQDVVFERLAGTYNVYVYGISPNVPPTLLQAVQGTLSDTEAYPLVGTAIAPDLIGISLETSVTLKAGLTGADQSAAIQAAITAASNYINNLNIGQTLVINEIAAQIINADPRILDIGDPDKPLDSIFIWRSRLDGSRYSRSLVSDYTPNVGERIVVEAIDDAVDLEAA